MWHSEAFLWHWEDTASLRHSPASSATQPELTWYTALSTGLKKFKKKFEMNTVE